MKLAIISHTEHYWKDGQIVGWGPTIREINHLTSLFEEIYHIAVLYDQPAPPSALPYTSDRIHFIPLQPFGGKNWKDKLMILRQIPAVLATVRAVLQKVDWFQFRAPTGIGVFLIPYLAWFSGRKGWFKYAGNWTQENPPLGYRFQRFFLAYLQKKKVTINGKWEGQPTHCLSFENPCLDEEDLRLGALALEQKRYDKKLHFCFVGRLEDAKGVGRILEAFAQIQSDQIGTIHLVGDGPQRAQYEQQAKQLPYPVIFHGFLSREKVNEIYVKSQVFLLPSDSEGFPKVLAEAMNFGCVPLVSAVSSIPQYIQDGVKGFLWQMDKEDFTNRLLQIIDHSNRLDFAGMAIEANRIAHKFTYDFYIERIQTDILFLKN